MDTINSDENNQINSNSPLNNNHKNYYQPLKFADSEFRDNSPIVLKLLLFLVGFLGFQIIGLILSLLIPAFTQDLILANALINLIAYSLTTILLFVCLIAVGKGKYIKMIFSGLKKGSIYLWGFLLVGFALLLETVFSLINSSIINALYGNISISNLNETSIDNILSSSYGFLMFVPIVLFAPIVEEFAYRLGLMDLIGKKNKKAGLIVSSLVFGLLHFNGLLYLIMIFSHLIGDGLPVEDNSLLSGLSDIDMSMEELLQAFVIECLNLPIYIVMGMALALAYLYSGNICSSIIAHMTNNGLSLAVTILSSSYVLPDILVKYSTSIVNSNFISFIQHIR